MRRVLVFCALAAPLLFGTATAAAQTFDDPAGDVRPAPASAQPSTRTSSGVNVESSGSQVSFTIEQYGSFTGPTAVAASSRSSTSTSARPRPQSPTTTRPSGPGAPRYGADPADRALRPLVDPDRDRGQQLPDPQRLQRRRQSRGHPRGHQAPQRSPTASTSPRSAAPARSNGGSQNPPRAPVRRRATPSPTRATWCPERALPASPLPALTPATTPKAKLKKAKKSLKKAKKSLKQAKQNGTDAQVAKAKKRSKR